MSELKEAIKKIAGTHKRDYVGLYMCAVDSVNESDRTCVCTPLSGEYNGQLTDVNLSAEPNDGMLLIPEIGSTVVVLSSTNSEYYVVMCSDIQKYLLTVGNSQLVIVDNEIKYNDGGFGGLIKIEELKSELDKVNGILQAIMNILSGAPITEAGNGAPSALQVALSAAILGKSLPTYRTIENTKIKHG